MTNRVFISVSPMAFKISKAGVDVLTASSADLLMDLTNETYFGVYQGGVVAAGSFTKIAGTTAYARFKYTISFGITLPQAPTLIFWGSQGGLVVNTDFVINQDVSNSSADIYVIFQFNASSVPFDVIYRIIYQ